MSTFVQSLKNYPKATGYSAWHCRHHVVFRLIRQGFQPLATLALLASLDLSAATNEAFDFRDGDRILLMGDTFFEREGDYGQIEARLTAVFGDRTLTFRNLSWAADTPLGRSRASFDWDKPETEWLKRVKEQVALVKPTVAFLSYGTTASFDGEAGIPKFKADLAKLMDAIDEVSGQKVRYALFSPIGFEKIANLAPSVIETNNVRLRLYSGAIREVADERHARFVPL